MIFSKKLIIFSFIDNKLDTWISCTPYFSLHCLDRMRERHLPLHQVQMAIVEGKKTIEKKDEYKIKWRGWILRISKRKCFFYIETVYRE